jgi:hypothetical protein
VSGHGRLLTDQEPGDQPLLMTGDARLVEANQFQRTASRERRIQQVTLAQPISSSKRLAQLPRTLGGRGRAVTCSSIFGWPQESGRHPRGLPKTAGCLRHSPRPSRRGDADCGAERDPNAQSPFDLAAFPKRVQPVSRVNPAPCVTAVTSNRRPALTPADASCFA